MKGSVGLTRLSEALSGTLRHLVSDTHLFHFPVHRVPKMYGSCVETIKYPQYNFPVTDEAIIIDYTRLRVMKMRGCLQKERHLVLRK